MKRKLLLLCFPLFGVLLTAYSPMASYSMAQSATDAKLTELKQKATDELNRRIANYQKTIDSLKVDIQLSANGGSGSAEVANGSVGGTVTCMKTDPTNPTPSASPASGQLGFNAVIGLPCGLKDKVLQFQQKVIDELKTLKDKVASVTSLTDMQDLAKNIDAQFKLDQVTQSQAGVTQAIGSMSGVLDKLKTAFSNTQSRVSALKDCLNGVVSPSASPSASPSTSPVDQAKECAQLKQDNGQGPADQAQGQLDGLSTIISTISSIVMSAITLLITLLTSFTGLLGSLTGGLGGLSSLTGLLGGATGGGGAGGLSSLTSMGGGLGGLLGSFTGILSQLNIGQSMAGGATSSLGSLTGLLGGMKLPF